MNLDKSQIIDMLKSKGDHDKAAKAESELPDQVDTKKDHGLLSKLGIDTGDLPGGGLASKVGL